MEQLRLILKIVYQQRFWILSVLSVLIAVVCWMLSAQDLDKQYQAEKSKVNTQFSSMRSLNGHPYYPNDGIIEKDREEVRALSAKVLKMWNELYDHQRSEVLYWPKELGDQFIQEIGELQFGDKIDQIMCGRYRDYIKDRFDGLLEIVQAKDLGDKGVGGGRGGREMGGLRGMGFEGMGGYDGMGGRGRGNEALEIEEEDYLVEWLDQGNVRQKLEWNHTPSPLRIWVTQEDLWVYQALLEVIAKTNKASDATSPENAAIGVIAELQLGQEAAQNSSLTGNLVSPPSADTGMGGREGYSREMMEGPMPGGRERLGEMGGGRGSYDGRDGGVADGDDSEAVLLAMRYVDETGQPLAEGSVAGVTAKPFRSLPVRMVLMMDQRWLPQLLVNCANQVLPIEVKRVSVNADQAGAGFGGTGAGRGGTAMRGRQRRSASEPFHRGNPRRGVHLQPTQQATTKHPGQRTRTDRHERSSGGELIGRMTLD